MLPLLTPVRGPPISGQEEEEVLGDSREAGGSNLKTHRSVKT